MDADYPAAHSMDTQWFAVDELGQVAVFDTGENGQVPEGHSASDLYWDFLEHITPVDSELEADVTEYGLYVFGHDYYDSLVQPYDREGVPATPLHVDQLPPRFRVRCTLRLPIRFDQTERVQPSESYPCVYYSSYSVAYVCADGVTVKPIPGQESLFAPFVREMRKEQPERAARFRFDGPTE